MQRVWLKVTIGLMIAILGRGRSDGQDTSRMHYVPSPNDIASYFQGELSASNGPTLALYYARYLHLMGERPLVDTANPSTTQFYRVLIETRPHNVPVVVRLSIEADGSGGVVAKIGQSPGFAGDLAMNRTATVSRKDIDDFLKRLGNSNFWTMPVLEPFDIHRSVEMGEASWMLEGEKEGSYHVVCRGTPRLASLRETAMYLVVHIGKVDLASVGNLPGDDK